MTDQPPGPPPGNYPPPPGNYPPPPPGNYPPPGTYPPPPPGNYPPPPPGNYPPPPPGDYPPPPPGNYPPPGGGGYPAPGYGSAPHAVSDLPQEAYTPWLSRVGAFLIDMLPVWLLSGIGSAIQFGTGNTTCVGSEYGYGGDCVSTPSTGGILINLVLSLAAFAFTLWNRGYRAGTTGQSIGKSVLKIKLVSAATGQPIGFGMAFVRDLAHFVDAIICYIGFLFPLWDAKRQTLADKMISTVVLPAA